jgi:hypothetical protein
MSNIEIWKNIPEYEGYQVSNLGNVKSLRFGKEIILKKSVKKKGLRNYYSLDLYKDKKRKHIKIHKLVAMAFLNHIPDGTQKIVVDHINNNSLDNRLENLQLITQRENASKDKKNKSSKYTGVTWDSTRNKWRVSVKINGRSKHLGRFYCEIEASEAYQKALSEINK